MIDDVTDIEYCEDENAIIIRSSQDELMIYQSSDIVQLLESISDFILINKDRSVNSNVFQGISEEITNSANFLNENSLDA